MSRRGQSLLAAVVLLALVLGLLPVVVYMVQAESRWTVKQERSDIAYQLAEAGQDRAVAYLARSDADWATATSSTAPAGFLGDVQYSDISGGLYTIRMSSGPGVGQVTVLTKGRDASTREVRSIKAVYANGSGDAASGPTLSGFVGQGAVSISNSLTIYWGAITSYTSITLASGAPYHPMKLSRGPISPWDTSSSPPNSDAAKNYTAYDTALVSPPNLDFQYYKEAAQNTILPNPQALGGSYGSQTAAWRGTGYFDAGTKTNQVDFKNYTFDCSTCVIYIEGDNAMIEGSGYIHAAAFIVKAGNIHIHNSGANPYTVSVPTDAWKQYTAGTAIHPYSGDTAAVNEYPGDGGLNVVQPTYTIPQAVFDGAGNTGMALHALLYAYSFNCSGGDNTLVGQFMVGPGGTSVNTMVIYYDPDIATNAHYDGGQVSRASWTELVSSWP